MHTIAVRDPNSIEEAVAVLRGGGIIVYPTETAYGLGADASNPQAVKKIFTIKGRDDGKPVPLITGSIDDARKLVVFASEADRLATAFWPGPLTMILPARDMSVAEHIHGSGTIGLRVSGLAWCRALALSLGHPLTSTSANATGMPPEYSLDAVRTSLGANADLVDLWADGGALTGGPVSTIVRFVDGFELLREGAISRAAIEKVLE